MNEDLRCAPEINSKKDTPVLRLQGHGEEAVSVVSSICGHWTEMGLQPDLSNRT